MSQVSRPGNGHDSGSHPPREFTTYAALLGKAHEEHLARITTELVQTPDDANHQTAVIRAEVETSRGVFVAFGDASPENVEDFLAPHLIRVAETRAKARALRDAVNVGVVSLEELDGRDRASGLSRPRSGADPGNGPEPRSAPRRPGRLSAPPRAPRSSPETPSIMTEAQRRYLFRLLAAKGLTGEAAQEEIRGRLGVFNLREIQKADAGALIDELLAEQAASHVPAR